VDTPAAVNFELSLSDYRAMSRQLVAGHRGEPLVWFVASFCLLGFARVGKAFIAGFIVGVLLLLIRLLYAQRRLRPEPGGALLCHYEIQLTSNGVHIETPSWTSDVPWRGIRAVEETPTHCFLRSDSVCVYTVPKRAFPNAEALRQFADFARDSVSRSQRAGTTGP